MGHSDSETYPTESSKSAVFESSRPRQSAVGRDSSADRRSRASAPRPSRRRRPNWSVNRATVVPQSPPTKGGYQPLGSGSRRVENLDHPEVQVWGIQMGTSCKTASLSAQPVRKGIERARFTGEDPGSATCSDQRAAGHRPPQSSRGWPDRMRCNLPHQCSTGHCTRSRCYRDIGRRYRFRYDTHGRRCHNCSSRCSNRRTCRRSSCPGLAKALHIVDARLTHTTQQRGADAGHSRVQLPQ